MKVLRHLLALVAVAVICPAIIIFFNMLVGYIFNPRHAASFLFFYLDAWAIPGIVASLLVGHRLANWIEHPRKKESRSLNLPRQRSPLDSAPFPR